MQRLEYAVVVEVVEEQAVVAVVHTSNIDAENGVFRCIGGVVLAGVIETWMQVMNGCVSISGSSDRSSSTVVVMVVHVVVLVAVHVV